MHRHRVKRIGGGCRLDRPRSDEGIEAINCVRRGVNHRCENGADRWPIKRKRALDNRCRERPARWPQDDAANKHSLSRYLALAKRRLVNRTPGGGARLLVPDKLGSGSNAWMVPVGANCPLSIISGGSLA